MRVTLPGRTRRIMGSALAVASIAAGTALVAGGPALAGPTVDGKSSTIVGSGSDTTFEVMHKLGGVYAGAPGCVVIATPGNTQPLDGGCISPTPGDKVAVNPDHDVIVNNFPLGSGNGVKQLCQQGLANVADVDFARSSRGLGGSDCDGVQFVSFARDGISWFHFTKVGGVDTASVGVNDLTQAQLKKIFVTGEITNWSQVGGSDAPIVTYAAQAGSGTRSAFDGMVGGDSSAQIPADKKSTRVIFENNAAPIIANGEAANAIFYYSFGRYSMATQGNSTGTQGATDELGKIDTIAPTRTTIGDTSFPYARSLYNVLRYPSEATKRLLDPVDGFLCRTDIDNVANAITGRKLREEIETAISSEGFVPLPKGSVGGGRVGQSYCRLTAKADVTAATVGFTPSKADTLKPEVQITFSEQVQGVSGSSVKLATDTGTVVPAQLTCTNARGEQLACDGATVLNAVVTPAGQLVPGRSYKVTVADTVVDRAGNPVLETSSDVWTAPNQVPATGAKGVWANSGGFLTARAKGAEASFVFFGTGASVTWKAGPANGKVAIYVDGKLKSTLSQYATKASIKTTSITGLTAGEHTIRAVVLGTKDKKSKGVTVVLGTVTATP